MSWSVASLRCIKFTDYDNHEVDEIQETQVGVNKLSAYRRMEGKNKQFSRIRQQK